MIDTEDYDDSDEEFNDENIEMTSCRKLKRDFRLEIERKLELIELRRKTGDYYTTKKYLTNYKSETKMNYFKGNGGCGLSYCS